MPIIGIIGSSAKGPFIATGGDEVVTVGGYKYHIFSNNGTFAVTLGSRSLSVTSCGGGGGSALDAAGAGGAGELDINTTVSATVNNYDVIIGAAGQNGLSPSTAPTNGGTTTFALGATIYNSSLGGGRGADSANAGQTGGSGGGGGYTTGNGSNSGSNTNAGGTGTNNGLNSYAGGGGGGATSAGGNASVAASSATGGNGGAGYTLTTIDANLTAANFPITLTGMTVICSGGGGSPNYNTGGGTRTAGIGGTGAGDSGTGQGATSLTSPTAATSYGSTGGAAGTNTSNAGVSFKGLVIVKYSV
jgi:hypothetical protein